MPELHSSEPVDKNQFIKYVEQMHYKAIIESIEQSFTKTINTRYKTKRDVNNKKE